MPNPNPTQTKAFLEKRFQRQEGKSDRPLAAKPLSIRLPADVDAAIRKLPGTQAWIRRVLEEGARQEGLL